MTPTPTPTGGDKPTRNVNPLLKLVMLCVAVPAMLIRKSQKALSEAVYDGFDGGFRALIGGILGLAAGIGTSYYLGWMQDFTTKAWLPAGILSLVLTYVYVWPLAYLGVFRALGKLSEALWRTVRQEERDSWVSDVLMFVGYAAIILGGAYFGWNILEGTRDHIAASWGWASFLAWPGGIVAGIFLGLVTGAIAWAILTFGKMHTVAAASGAGLTYLFHARIAALVTPLLTRFGAPAELVWLGYAIAFALWVAYLFPLIHVFLTHVFGRFVKWVAKLPEQVYGREETASSYRQFFAQVVNIAGAVQFARIALKVAAHYELAPVYGYIACGVVAFLSFVLLGQWLKTASNRLPSVITLLHIPFMITLPLIASGAFYGWVGAVVVSAVAAFLTYAIVFPLGYVTVRLLAKPLLASWLTKPLTWLHATAYNGLDRLVDEIGHAFSNTYSDRTPYRELFLHVVNLTTTAGSVYGLIKLGAALGFANWLTFGLATLGAVVAYVLLGKLFLKAGNYLVGTLIGLAAGVATGTIGYAYLPTGSVWWIIAAVGIGLVGAFLAFSVVFPLVYIVVRLVANPLCVGWLRPALVGAYDWSWKRCEALWNEFVETYRAAEAWFKPYWASISQTWDDTWQSVKEQWEKTTGGK